MIIFLLLGNCHQALLPSTSFLISLQKEPSILGKVYNLNQYGEYYSNFWWSRVHLIQQSPLQNLLTRLTISSHAILRSSMIFRMATHLNCSKVSNQEICLKLEISVLMSRNIAFFPSPPTSRLQLPITMEFLLIFIKSMDGIRFTSLSQ